MTERKLGKGLDFLMKRTAPAAIEVAPQPKPEAPAKREPAQRIATTSIRPNPYQPRRSFGIEQLNELIESIRIHGIIQPIAVRVAPDGFELISGERRWRAAQELGLETVPVVVHEADDQAMLEFALIENIQREDLDPVEKAKAYRQLIRQFNLTQEEAARRLGQKRSTVANFMRLLELPAPIQDLLVERLLPMGHARALLAIQGESRQVDLARQAAQGKLTVRDIERLAQLQGASTLAADAALQRKRQDPHLAEVSGRIREALGTKVSLAGGAKRGKIVIEYYDTDSLNRILACIENGAERRDREASAGL
ncbi:MAG: ParB/RepB/Spo0J family partition protein [Planctomycetes bacterium]|nr:ParB/RepB/Spo0J family partition protein [Planctomycetota bacterium]